MNDKLIFVVMALEQERTDASNHERDAKPRPQSNHLPCMSNSKEKKEDGEDDGCRQIRYVLP